MSETIRRPNQLELTIKELNFELRDWLEFRCHEEVVRGTQDLKRMLRLKLTNAALCLHRDTPNIDLATILVDEALEILSPVHTPDR